MIKATVNQSIYEVKEGTTLSDLAKQVQLPQEPIILLAYMDGKLRELFTPMTKDCHVRFVTLKEQAGYMAYKRTATLMFLKSMRRSAWNWCNDKDRIRLFNRK